MNDEIRSILRTINDSWLSRNVEELPQQLAPCFHSDMIIKDGNLMTVARGREECVRSYVDFIRETQVSHFEQTEPDIHVCKATAVASYGWRIIYIMNGQQYDEAGHDIFAFAHTEGKWLAVWRAMLTQ